MSDNFSWSTSIGRWFGIPVSLHVFLLLFLVAIFSVEWQFVSENPGSRIIGTGLVTSIVLLASLLLHELAHLFAITNLGGEVKQLVLMPWGGSSNYIYPNSNSARAIVHFAGMFVNGFLFLIGAMLLVNSGNGMGFGEIINPFDPHGFDANNWEVSLIAIVTWVNFQLFAVNTIPCFPFDGAEILRSFFHTLNSDLSTIKIETTIMAIGHLVAVALIGVAWLLPPDAYNSLIGAPWAILVIAGVALIFASRFSCHKEITESIPSDWDELEEDMDQFDRMYLDSDTPRDLNDQDQYSQWLVEKRAERERMERELIEEEDRQADEILDKLHREGPDSLTDSDKALLARVSERIRKRRQNADF